MSEDEKKCGCGHHHEEGHQCCGGHHHEEGHQCCGGHHHEEGHQCCGGHHHEEGHQCGCGHHHEEGGDMPQDVPLPDPSLITLVSSIATQAMVSMGIFPNPGTGKSEFYFNQARHLIDTVDLIIQKTEGNRTDEETKTLTNVLHELQMLFVAAQNEKNRRDAEGK